MTNCDVSGAPKRGSEHERLDLFVGKWHAEGDSYADGQSRANPHGSAAKWTSDETYEWLPGEFFLVHHWDARIDNAEFKGIEVIGYDHGHHEYVAQFENHGFARTYLAHPLDNVWTFAGETERAKVAFNSAGDTMEINWEWKPDGENWMPLCDRRASRVGETGEPDMEMRVRVRLRDPARNDGERLNELRAPAVPHPGNSARPASNRHRATTPPEGR